MVELGAAELVAHAVLDAWSEGRLRSRLVEDTVSRQKPRLAVVATGPTGFGGKCGLAIYKWINGSEHEQFA